MTGPLPSTPVTAVELIRVDLPLRAPFRTSFGTQASLDRLLVRLETPDAEGWGESVAPAAPIYSSEYTDGVADVIEHHLLPRLWAHGPVSAEGFGEAVAGVRGHRIAKATLEMALLDAQLRTVGRSLASHLGAVRDRVPCGVSIGIPDAGVPALLDQVDERLAEGYLRIKIKIEPGFDLEPVSAIRDRFGSELRLQVDANAAYTLDDLDLLRELDHYDLELIEQPFEEERVLAHAALADAIRTPVCLDESIVDAASAADAISLGACSIVNIKAGRVGGYLEAVRVHDVCRSRGIPVWCGGMLETGLGRAANVALAALPQFRLPGDTSASDRYWAEDLTEPFVLEADGHLPVPDGPGIGRVPRPEVLDEVTTQRRTVRPR